MSNMVVQTNVLALNSHRNLGMTGNVQARASARLSSGFRINSAADDAAGLAISEKMRGQIRGLDQASRNAQDGISLIQTAEGAMSTVNDMVIRIRELVVQASNDTNAHDSTNMAQSDRIQIQREINQLLEEIDDVTLRTEFNTRTLLDGSLDRAHSSFRGSFAEDVTPTILLNSGVAVMGGTDIIQGPGSNTGTGLTAAQNNFMMNLINNNAQYFNSDLTQGGRTFDAAWVIANLTSTELQNLMGRVGNSAAVGTPGTTGAAGTGPVGTVGGTTGTLGTAGTAAGVSRTMVTGFNVGTYAFDGTVAANSAATRIAQFLNNVRANTVAALEPDVTEIDGAHLWFHVGANVGQGVELNVQSVNVTRLDQIGRGLRGDLAVSAATVNNATAGFSFADLRNNGVGHGAGVMRDSGQDINRFITSIDAALAHVASERASLGAMQNRLEFTIENLDVASENLSAANSRIRDADMAREMMSFTQANVLQQAAISMLSQANQAPQNILQLLR